MTPRLRVLDSRGRPGACRRTAVGRSRTSLGSPWRSRPAIRGSAQSSTATGRTSVSVQVTPHRPPRLTVRRSGQGVEYESEPIGRVRRFVGHRAATCSPQATSVVSTSTRGEPLEPDRAQRERVPGATYRSASRDYPGTGGCCQRTADRSVWTAVPTTAIQVGARIRIANGLTRRTSTRLGSRAGSTRSSSASFSTDAIHRLRSA